jgi:hypothetical protein
MPTVQSSCCIKPTPNLPDVAVLFVNELDSARTRRTNTNQLRTCLAVLAAFVLGALLYRPLSVKAASGIGVQALKEGYNGIQGEEIVGFSCTQNACYIATR